jgi:hypothetical protein
VAHRRRLERHRLVGAATTGHIADHGIVTETEIIEYISGLPGVVSFTAREENSAPEAAWGDTFFFYDPEGDRAENQRLPFATIVTHDYAGWDAESQLDREGIFRVNIAVGRSGAEQLLGHSPAQHEAHHHEFDYAATDVLIPHPTYASQGWVSILNPAERTSNQVRQLIDEAHALAVRRQARRLDARQSSGWFRLRSLKDCYKRQLFPSRTVHTSDGR